MIPSQTKIKLEVNLSEFERITSCNLCEIENTTSCDLIQKPSITIVEKILILHSMKVISLKNLDVRFQI